MDVTVQLASVERVEGERVIATFDLDSSATGKVQLHIAVEAMSGHHAAEQARHSLRDFAHGLVRALENPDMRV